LGEFLGSHASNCRAKSLEALICGDDHGMFSLPITKTLTRPLAAAGISLTNWSLCDF
jgi:hypothetical protein